MQIAPRLVCTSPNPCALQALRPASPASAIRPRLTRGWQERPLPPPHRAPREGTTSEYYQSLCCASARSRPVSLRGIPLVSPCYPPKIRSPESTDWVIILSAGQKHRNSNRKQRGRGDRHRRRHRSTPSSPLAPALPPRHPPARPPVIARSFAWPLHASDNCRYLNHSRSLVHVPDVAIRYRFAIDHIAVHFRPPPGQKREQPGQRVSAHMRRHGQTGGGVRTPVLDQFPSLEREARRLGRRPATFDVHCYRCLAC